jgi:tetratricopeptide (TPR) repeat protein
MIESVAWITELKNTLSLPPLLLAMLAWLAWGNGGERRFYFRALGFFVVAMLAKTSGMMLPVIFLVHAWWLRGKITVADLKATLPFFAVALMAGLITLLQPLVPGASDGVRTIWHLGSALATVGWTTLFLLGKCLFPFWLLPSYPDLTVTSPSLIDFLPWLALAVLLGLLWAHRTNWSRHILFGLGFFLVNLVPVLGYTFIAYTHMVWSMDHLLYLPVIGWIALAVAGLGYLNSRISSLWRAIGTVPVAAGVMLMAWSGHVYAGWFASPELFWSNLLRRDPGSWLSDLNLASVYLRQHRYPEALAYSRETVRLAPDDSDGHYDLGLALEKSSQVEEAENEYRKAIQLDPKNSKALTSLGDIMRKAGRLAEAEDLFRQGLKAAPDDGALCIDLGGLLLQSGQSLEGIALYEHALELNPDLPQLQYDLGVALLRTGNPAEGVEHLEAAVRLDPKLAVAHETPRRRPGPIGPGARGDRAISGRDSARSAIRHREGQPRLCAGADGPHSGSHRTIPACAADQSGGREGA